MEWVLRSPQIHSTFGSLGFAHGDGYHVNENCNAALETILHNIMSEDKYLRSYRRSISFGQNVNKDLIPLLLNASEDKTLELLIRILVNLTIPIECLLSVDVISKTDFGRHTVFEINSLLTSTKAAFTDLRATKVIIDFLKKNVEVEQNGGGLSVEQCANISNSLLLLRNILHIPEEAAGSGAGACHTVQNQILWNIFSQSIDKILIKLMTVSDAANWGVTMVQMIALLYKDQHVVTLHKLLNLWLEASLSESSEDNESNTSPPDRGSEDSSPMLTSDPTSDSSDTGGSGKSNDEPNSVNNEWSAPIDTLENSSTTFQQPMLMDKNSNEAGSNENAESRESKDQVDSGSDVAMKSVDDSSDGTPSQRSKKSKSCSSTKTDKKTTKSENSDCGYGTQIENQESISTSSNEDEVPTKPVHQKPHNPKQRVNNNKGRVGITLQERKRKKIVKRGKANIINVQGLSHKTPTDDDISNVLKEFTVDFLLKGYNSLVQTLHTQILSNAQLEIDTSHFFWLVTYFLKFATQIELDVEHICSVLSFDIVSYLTAEGVNLCEQFELAIKLDGNDLKPSIRRLHLVVTAIREFVQAIEAYKKFTHICKEDLEMLVKLQMKMCETEELRSLLLLLLRHYNPKYHSKQYLQDLVVTNHILLLFLDNIINSPDYKGSNKMNQHIKQFATPEIMYQYGLLLEDYTENGEFVNDCVFTMMHHIGGELDSLITLFQPKILKTFSSIWKSEFEICDDWSDLIEYVINTFIKKPHSLQSAVNVRLDTENFDDDSTFHKPPATPLLQDNQRAEVLSAATKKKHNSTVSHSSKDRWTEDELSSLSWNYMQCNTSLDVIGEIVKLFKDDGIMKSRDSVLRELFRQNIMNKAEFETATKEESERNCKTIQINKESVSGRDDEIGKLCEQLALNGKSSSLDWVQKVLLETCLAKIYWEKKSNLLKDKKEKKILNFEVFSKQEADHPVLAPVSYHALIYNQSVPLVPWNCEQAATCKDLKFLQLLHKLGFHMPVDTGKVFIRIPHFWTADFLYEVAGKILPINTSALKFSVKDIEQAVSQKENLIAQDHPKTMNIIAAPENLYQIHKQKHLAAVVNFTPMPGSSFMSDADSNKQNWLEIVQKSQERKINFAAGRSFDKDEEMQPEAAGDALLPPGLRAGMAPPLVMPTVMTAKQDSSPFSLHVSDSEYYNNSVCETASVASDLTRMYVSDEDEKPEVLLAMLPAAEPGSAVAALLQAPALAGAGCDVVAALLQPAAPADPDSGAVKRPRVISPPLF